MPGFELEFAGTTRAQRHAPVPRLTDEQKQRARVAVCALAGRGLDVQIPEHRAAAARNARPVLEALGLLGDETIRMSRYSKSASSVVHGTGSAVEAHEALGQDLCQPCRRWLEVKRRKDNPHPIAAAPASAVEQAAEEPVGAEHTKGEPSGWNTACGTVSGYNAHRANGEAACQRCRDAIADYHRDRRARGKSS